MQQYIFSFGSNSIVQLRARVMNPGLVSLPAYVDNWARIFCLSVPLWGDSGVASLAAMPGARTYGALVALTSQELETLDSYEIMYRRESIDVFVKNLDGQFEERKAFAYLCESPYWESPPSEAYLTAIHLMLREQHPCEVSDTISINGILRKQARTDVEHLYTWRYPGLSALSLSATIVEVNARKSSHWVMPHKISDIKAALAKVDVHSAAQLASWLVKDKGVSLNSRLRAAEAEPLSDEEIVLFMRCFGIENI